MTQQQLQPPINKYRLWLWLTITAIIVGLLQFAAASLFEQGAINRTDVSIIAAKTWFATMITTLPVVLLGSRGVTSTIAAYLIGTGTRMAICLVIAFLATRIMNVANLSVLIGMVPMYLTLMAVEVAFVGRYLWLKDDLASSTGEKMEMQA